MQHRQIELASGKPNHPKGQGAVRVSMRCCHDDDDDYDDDDDDDVDDGSVHSQVSLSQAQRSHKSTQEAQRGPKRLRPHHQDPMHPPVCHLLSVHPTVSKMSPRQTVCLTSQLLTTFKLCALRDSRPREARTMNLVLYVYTYKYIHICMCVYDNMYVYIYIHRVTPLAGVETRYFKSLRFAG